MAAEPAFCRPLISVIIPTQDRPRLLDAALGSVHTAAQQVDGNVEVIIVNDGGASVAWLARAWRHELAIRFVELDHSLGAAAARNTAINLATGRYLAFLDDDDLFLPDHLAAGCQPLMTGEADFVYLGALVSEQRRSSLPADLAAHRTKAYPYDPRLLAVANYLHTGSVIVRNFNTSTVRFDDSLTVCEDGDLWIALTTQLNYRVTALDKITTIYHQVPQTTGLVATGQLTSPSLFTLARTHIYAKWPSGDPTVAAYRQWMLALESHRDTLIAARHRMPNLLFDDVLAYLHQRFNRQQLPDYDDIEMLLARCAQPAGASR